MANAGLRGIFGRHGTKQREAIQPFLPYLKDVLREPGALGNTDKKYISAALTKAVQDGVQPCWGRHGQVCKSRRNVQNAILNVYYSHAVDHLQE